MAALSTIPSQLQCVPTGREWPAALCRVRSRASLIAALPNLRREYCQRMPNGRFADLPVLGECRYRFPPPVESKPHLRHWSELLVPESLPVSEM